MLADDSDADRQPVWTPRDRLLVQALELFEASLCPGCNQQRARSMNPGMGGEYQVPRHTCYACAALERARKGDEIPPGSKDFIVDAGPDSAELPVWRLDLRPLTDEEADQDG